MNLFSMCREQGHALLELAIVFPLLTIVAFAGIEFSRAIKYYQLSTFLSREAASLAYRDCIGGSTDPDNIWRMKACLFRVSSSLEKFAADAYGGKDFSTEISLSVYAYNPASNSFIRYAISANPDGSEEPSRFHPDGSQLLTPQGSFIRPEDLAGAEGTHERLFVIGEAQVPFGALLPGITAAFFGPSKRFYDATLI